MPEKGFRFDEELDRQMADFLLGFLKPATVRHTLQAFGYLEDATAGKHQAMTSYLIGYLACMFNAHYLKEKHREPTDAESLVLMEWLTEAVVPIIESTLTEYEARKELR